MFESKKRWSINYDMSQSVLIAGAKIFRVWISEGKRRTDFSKWSTYSWKDILEASSFEILIFLTISNVTLVAKAYLSNKGWWCYLTFHVWCDFETRKWELKWTTQSDLLVKVESNRDPVLL